MYNIINNTLNTSYNSCFYSSFVFIINIAIALYYSYYLYAALFFALLITSLLQHSHYNMLTTILDKIVIFSIVFYGGSVFYSKINNINNNESIYDATQYILSFLIMLTFFSTIVLYYYGYFNNCLCFCDDQNEANLFHSFMHCVGSFGHCCIVLL